ncbi:MAG: metallophosphoesterase [Christensenellaceae bacterium]|jgi:predicted MPP superfamily phosphohydrolase|nr:metallophosphoesterase [Christensenellaceae bacterium]
MLLKKLRMRRRLLFAIPAILCIIAVTLAVIYIIESRFLALGNTQVEGTLTTYDWSSDDTLDVNSFKSIQTTDGSIKILQLTDIHYRNLGTFGALFGINYITDGYMKLQTKSLINAHKPDLIIISGDLITHPAADAAYKELADFFGGFGIPWTVAFGNHDGEYNADKAALAQILESAPNSYFDAGPTNLEGIGQHVITVKNAGGEITQLVIIMDTNDEVLKIYPERKYATLEPGIYPNQIEWYKWIVNQFSMLNNGKPLPSSIFMHINLAGYPEDPAALTNALHKSGTGYIFYGHTHSSGEIYQDNNIFYINGVKSGINYMDSGNTTGGTFIQLFADYTAEITLVATKLFTFVERGPYTYSHDNY